MTGLVYRIRVEVDVAVKADRPLTRDELDAVGRRVALGMEVPHHGIEPDAGSVAVAIRAPDCQDPDHRRNSIDGRTYMCGAYADDPIHGSVDDCPGTNPSSVCTRPGEHHEFMSPGFEGAES